MIVQWNTINSVCLFVSSTSSLILDIFFIRSCSYAENFTRIHEGSCSGPRSCTNSTGDLIVYKNSCTEDK